MYIWLHIEFLTAVIKISQISSSQWTCSKENYHILWIGSHNAETIYVLIMKIGDIKKFQTKMLFSKSNTYFIGNLSYPNKFLRQHFPPNYLTWRPQWENLEWKHYLNQIRHIDLNPRRSFVCPQLWQRRLTIQQKHEEFFFPKGSQPIWEIAHVLHMGIQGDNCLLCPVKKQNRNNLNGVNDMQFTATNLQMM